MQIFPKFMTKLTSIMAKICNINFKFQFQIFISDLVIDHRIPSQLGGQVDFAI